MAEKRKAAEKTVERRDEKEMQGKERELLYGTADQYGIYQLKDDPALSGLHKGTWTLRQGYSKRMRRLPWSDPKTMASSIRGT